VTDFAPVRRCPFCHETTRAIAGGAPVKSRTADSFYSESEFSYRCSRGHEFNVVEMVTGEAPQKAEKSA
jgi:hypothetical protein